jgi:hypothetical protein
MPSKERVMAVPPVDPPVTTNTPLRRATAWPVDWSAVWVGALSAVLISLIVALIGVAIGAHATAASRIVHWKEFGLGSLIFAILGAFLAFAAGGWVAGRIAGYRWSEPAILHGAIAWLVGMSLVVTLGSIGTTPLGRGTAESAGFAPRRCQLKWKTLTQRAPPGTRPSGG